MTIVDQAQVEEAVAQATSEEKFDVLDFFSGASLPETEVTVYADAGAAFRLAQIKSEEKERAARAEEEGISLTDDVGYTDEDEVDELARRLQASAVIFKLRGLAPAAHEALEKHARAVNPFTEGAENREYNEAYNASLIASTIVSVRNAKGVTDKNKWDAARVLAFAEKAQPSEFERLYIGVFNVNFLGDAIDRAVSADF